MGRSIVSDKLVTVHTIYSDRMLPYSSGIRVVGGESSPYVSKPYITIPKPGPLFIDENLPIKIDGVVVEDRDSYHKAIAKLVEKMMEKL